MVYLVIIRHTAPLKSFRNSRECPFFPDILIFVKDDWVRLLFTETINPHPSLSSCRSTIFSYLYHSFIRVYNMIIRKFLLHTVVYIAQIPYRSHDHPTAQSLRWKKYFTVLNLFGETYNRLRIHIHQVANTGHKGC